MPLHISDIRKPSRNRLEPLESFRSIEENIIYANKIELISDGNIQRQCLQNLQIKEAANRIYNLSKNFFQKLDAAKASLVSGQRIEMVSSKYESHIRANKNDQGTFRTFKGQITLSNIKIPLLWKSINGQPFANGVYSMFCVVKAGVEVLESQLICDIDSNMNDVVFKDVFQINDVDYDAVCTLELYGYATNTSSVALTRKYSKSQTSDSLFLLQNRRSDFKRDEKYPFKFLGSTHLCLDDLRKTECSCCIQHMKYHFDCDVPLFGTLSCRFLMIPMTKVRCLFCGHFWIQFISCGDSRKNNWDVYYGEVKNRALHLWIITDQIEGVKKDAQPLLRQRKELEGADQIVPLMKKTQLSIAVLNGVMKYLRIITYSGSKTNDYQEILIKTDNLYALHEILRSHIDEIDMWDDSFHFDGKIPQPTSLLTHGSVYRNSVNLK